MRSKAPAGFGGRLPGKGPHLPIWDLAGQPILSTSRWPPPTSTCTPTWRRKSEPSPESPRPTRRLAATSRPTRYSPSSTASDCSDLPPVDSPATHTNPRSGRNNHDVGSIGVVPTSGQRRIGAAQNCVRDVCGRAQIIHLWVSAAWPVGAAGQALRGMLCPGPSRHPGGSRTAMTVMRGIVMICSVRRASVPDRVGAACAGPCGRAFGRQVRVTTGFLRLAGRPGTAHLPGPWRCLRWLGARISGPWARWCARPG